MNPLTSLCFMLTGISIWLIRTEELHQKYNRVTLIICSVIIVYCSIIFLARVLGIDFRPDKILIDFFIDDPEKYGLSLNYKAMAVNNALSLILVNLSVILIDNRKAGKFFNYQVLNYISIFIAFLTIYGYIYGVKELYTSFGTIPMSFYSAVLIILLSAALLFIRPYKGSMLYVVGQNPTEVFLMRFLAFFIPLFLGYFKIAGEAYHLFSREGGTLILAGSTYVISMTLLGWKSTIQYKLQLAKQEQVDIVKHDRERIERILNKAQTMIQIIDIQENKFVFSNIYGTISSKSEIEGKSITELINQGVYPDDLFLAEERNKQFPKLKDGEYNDITLRLLGPDGKIMWIYSRAIVYNRDAEGRVKEILLNSIDITKEKEEEEMLVIEKENLEKQRNKLEDARKALKVANEYLEEEAEHRETELFKSEKRYHDYIRNSFHGIIEFEHKGDHVDVEMPIKEQIEEIKRTAVIKEVNKAAAKLHGYNDPKEMKGIMLVDLLHMPDEIVDAYMEEFIRSNYRLLGKTPVQMTKKGDPVKVYMNVLGIVKNKRLIKGWEIQTPYKLDRSE